MSANFYYFEHFLIVLFNILFIIFFFIQYFFVYHLLDIIVYDISPLISNLPFILNKLLIISTQIDVSIPPKTGYNIILIR
jgi:hypothetical protein